MQDPEEVGFGYVRLIRDYLRAAKPQNAPQVINMGISGNKITDLADRWEHDVIRKIPDVLSIKVAINDVWHGLQDVHAGVPADEFRRIYAQLLQQVRDRLPECTIVLCEPTVIDAPVHERGNEFLAPYIKAIRELGEEFDVSAIIPLHGAFVIATKQRPDIQWTTDGVHPTSSGHMLIARTWLETTKNL
jgi:lysophospholipase L1-like esterase